MNPGDLIVGDIVGVVVVPPRYCPTLLRRLRGGAKTEADYLQAVAEGRFSNAWSIPPLPTVASQATTTPSRTW